MLVTNHSVFLTLVAVNGPTFEKLSKEQKAIVKEEEARTLTLDERALPIRQEIDGRKKFEAQGIQFIGASAEDKRLLEEMAVKVHKKYEDQKVGDVMRAIINTK